ncbi:MAG: ubiquitin-like protein [Bacteroidota bacterium]
MIQQKQSRNTLFFLLATLFIGSQTVQASFQITVKTLTGLKFQITVEESDTIQKVKKKIHAQQGFVPEIQKLIYTGHSNEELENESTIKHYEIQKGETIHLIFKPVMMKVTVKYEKKEFEFYYDNKTLIKELKNEINTKFNIKPNEQILTFEDDNKELSGSDNDKLNTLTGVSAGTTLILKAKGTNESPSDPSNKGGKGDKSNTNGSTYLIAFVSIAIVAAVAVTMYLNANKKDKK